MRALPMLTLARCEHCECIDSAFDLPVEESSYVDDEQSRQHAQIDLPSQGLLIDGRWRAWHVR